MNFVYKDMQNFKEWIKSKNLKENYSTSVSDIEKAHQWDYQFNNWADNLIKEFQIKFNEVVQEINVAKDDPEVDARAVLEKLEVQKDFWLEAQELVEKYRSSIEE